MAMRMKGFLCLAGPARHRKPFMRIAILTNEYPPHVYGGAGVHVEYLTRELVRIDDGRHTVQVLCFGDQAIRQGNLSVQGVRPESPIPCQDPRHVKLMDTLVR